MFKQIQLGLHCKMQYTFFHIIRIDYGWISGKIFEIRIFVVSYIPNCAISDESTFLHLPFLFTLARIPHYHTQSQPLFLCCSFQLIILFGCLYVLGWGFGKEHNNSSKQKGSRSYKCGDVPALRLLLLDLQSVLMLVREGCNNNMNSLRMVACYLLWQLYHRLLLNGGRKI